MPERHGAGHYCEHMPCVDRSIFDKNGIAAMTTIGTEREKFPAVSASGAVLPRPRSV